MMDDIFEGEEEAEEDIYNQIFDEVGIEFNQKVTQTSMYHMPRLLECQRLP